MSGLFTPIESMPEWAQKLTEYNPIRYFIEVIRMVMLKGSTFKDILPQLIRIILFAVVMNTLAVVSYKKVN
jgi:ABC-2 type transport system permease protein